MRQAVSADVTAGEYGNDLYYFRRMCQAGAVDCLQVDLSRCGGITEWLRAATVAASFSLKMSAHCAPNLHVHAAAAAATPNLRHIEWFHDHVRIETMFFDGTLDPSGGSITPDSLPGTGLTLRQQGVERYRVRLARPTVGASATHTTVTGPDSQHAGPAANLILPLGPAAGLGVPSQWVGWDRP